MEIQEVISAIQGHLGVSAEIAVQIFTKSKEGGEMLGISPQEWFELRFLPNVIQLDETDYSKMCVDALKIVATASASDYGGSRQRDLAQVWADTTRGYLGEQAVVKFLKTKYDTDSELAHEVGAVQAFLPQDIYRIRPPGKEWRDPRLKISIKTTKWNGIWLDIPGAQFEHSDVYILVKIGGEREGLLSFLKSLSVFKDKVIKRGQDIGALTQTEATKLYDQLPSFKNIPAYICGFALRSDEYQSLDYGGKKGRLHFKIHSWRGPYQQSDLSLIKKSERLKKIGSVEFLGVQKFAHKSAHLFNAGNLHWKGTEWRNLLNSI